MKLMKLMHVVLSLGRGGTERLVIDMCKRLKPSADLSVVCLDEAGTWASELTDVGMEVIAMHRQPGFCPSLGWRIVELAKQREAQVLHCHHYSPFVYGAVAARLHPKLRLVYTEHGRLSDKPPSAKRRLANTLFGRLPGAFFAVSDDLRCHMVAEGFPPKRVSVNHNGIEPGPVATPADRLRARQTLGLSETDLVMATVARLDPVKDLATLIAAFALLAPRWSNAQLIIVGDGPEKRRLEQAAVDAQLDNRVRFTASRDDVRQLLPAFDLFVNSSISEGISVTILEAMAASLPVVATHVGGTSEVVVEGVTGLLVPPHEPQPLCDALERLVVDQELRHKMGEAARQRLERHFAVDRMVETYMQAYQAA